MIDAMRAAGLAPTKDLGLAPDGKIVRYQGEGDARGKRNCWAVLHDGPVPCGAFGSWKTGASHTWSARDTRELTPTQRAEQQRQLGAMRQARAVEQANVQASARERAARLWATARPATNAHPYLQRKSVPAYGIRQLRNMLVIPARDAEGRLHTLQFVGEDGSKRFLTGGRIRGCYFSIGRIDHSILLAEGLATASTLHLATGQAVAACFNCTNLAPVALALRNKFLRLRLVVCADNDQATAGNPGLAHAKTAAQAVGGLLAVPQFETEA